MIGPKVLPLRERRFEDACGAGYRDLFQAGKSVKLKASFPIVETGPVRPCPLAGFRDGP